MRFYIALEFFLLVMNVLFNILDKTNVITKVLNILPALITVLFLIIQDKKCLKKALFMSLCFALLGDIAFNYLGDIYGIAFFLITQVCYYIYLNKKHFSKLFINLVSLSTLLVCYILKNKIIVIISLLYASFSVYNYLKGLEVKKKLKNTKEIIEAYTFLNICDFCVFINFVMGMFKEIKLIEYSIYTIQEIFYVLFFVSLSFGLVKNSLKRVTYLEEDLIY